MSPLQLSKPRERGSKKRRPDEAAFPSVSKPKDVSACSIGECELTPPEVVEEIFRNYAPRVYAVALRTLGNESDAEDVTQEVLVQVIRRMGGFRGEAAIVTWLYRVTVNAALGLRRKRATAKVRHTEEYFDSAEVVSHSGREPARRPEELALNNELRDVLEAAIRKLPEMYRDPLVLADVEGLPNSEVGELLDLSLPAVKSRLHRARIMMREALTPYMMNRGELSA